MITITKLEDHRVQDYVKLKKNLADEIILDGKNVLTQYLKTNTKIISIFLTDTFYSKNRSYVDKLTCEKFITSSSLANKIIGYKFHNGLMAKVPSPSLSKLENIKGPVVALNAVTGPENVGMILRNAKAFGIKNILFDSRSVSPYMRRCVRVSIGHVFSLNIFHTDEIVKFLKSKNYSVFGTSVKGQINFQLDKNCALIFGSEGSGMDEELIIECDKIIKIDTVDNISINVGCASAVLISKFNLS